jgi:hypothetical protein
MNVGSTSGIDAFMAARAAASRRIEAAASTAPQRARTLTPAVPASEDVAATAPSKAPVKGKYIDVLA